MTIVNRATRLGGVFAVLLAVTSVATTASAEEGHGQAHVDISVVVDQTDEPGSLSMSVSGTSTVLTEGGSTGPVRQFTGVLPTVTVTDTRLPDQIEPGTSWYVLGTSSDFVSNAGLPPIGADHFGWAPSLLSGEGPEGAVPGDVVDTVLDTEQPNAFGLVDQELLLRATDSAAVLSQGSWMASADLFLRVPSTVAPGGYSATLTLSLFEWGAM